MRRSQQHCEVLRLTFLSVRPVEFRYNNNPLPFQRPTIVAHWKDRGTDTDLSSDLPNNLSLLPTPGLGFKLRSAQYIIAATLRLACIWRPVNRLVGAWSHVVWFKGML